MLEHIWCFKVLVQYFNSSLEVDAFFFSTSGLLRDTKYKYCAWNKEKSFAISLIIWIEKVERLPHSIVLFGRRNGNFLVEKEGYDHLLFILTCRYFTDKYAHIFTTEE